jgi:hypothetical protein
VRSLAKNICIPRHEEEEEEMKDARAELMEPDNAFSVNAGKITVTFSCYPCFHALCGRE